MSQTNQIEVSTKEFAIRLGVDYVQANALIRFLEKRGEAEHVLTRKTGGKGRGTKIYKIARTIKLEF